MDWTLTMILLGFAALLGGRLCVGLWFEGSALNGIFERIEDWACESDADDSGDGGD
ncbi:hypothetical protein ROJ8625_03114 [Roseivivax jejudonensis]|uniref:Uncharacterized protein n=1 Tax=Roseivivax jejudonensis TaxID=1529041 RepID=A0A1X6ZTN8_9RHOB|nr:hypothetical protein [Roseivivax jejudonensis]SLN61212.1 hypothetical protein ROJ8625_03114 [Roseivivax jejudonensis]